MKTLVMGNKSQVVKDCQYLLIHNRWDHNFHPGQIDGVFGDQMANAIKRAKYFLGYPDTAIVPVFGDKLYHYLLPKARDGWVLPVRFQARKKLRRPKVASRRTLVCDYARWAVAREFSISYAQTRPIPELPWRLPYTTDCSGFVTMAYHAAGSLGALHSNGRDGNTDTLVAHGRVVTASQLRPADLVFYDDPDHVGIYMGGGMVIEHGSSRGPRWEPTNYRRVTHRRSYLP